MSEDEASEEKQLITLEEVYFLLNSCALSQSMLSADCHLSPPSPNCETLAVQQTAVKAAVNFQVVKCAF